MYAQYIGPKPQNKSQVISVGIPVVSLKDARTQILRVDKSVDSAPKVSVGVMARGLRRVKVV